MRKRLSFSRTKVVEFAEPDTAGERKLTGTAAAFKEAAGTIVQIIPVSETDAAAVEAMNAAFCKVQ